MTKLEAWTAWAEKAMGGNQDPMFTLEKSSLGNAFSSGYDAGMEAARQQIIEEQKPIDSSEKAGAYMDARLWEFIDMAAAWPKSRPDLRTWDHVMVYAPKQPEQEPVACRTTHCRRGKQPTMR